MISVIESFVKDVLVEYSDNPGEWVFSEFYDENGNTVPQAIQYAGDSRWYSYPDYEFKNDNKKLVLVELKTYDTWFDEVEYVLAMKLRQFESYLKISKETRINTRICFCVWVDGDINFFWQNIKELKNAKNKVVRPHTRKFHNKETNKIEEKTEDYIFWDVTNFREDYWNLPAL